MYPWAPVLQPLAKQVFACQFAWGTWPPCQHREKESQHACSQPSSMETVRFAKAKLSMKASRHWLDQALSAPPSCSRIGMLSVHIWHAAQWFTNGACACVCGTSCDHTQDEAVRTVAKVEPRMHAQLQVLRSPPGGEGGHAHAVSICRELSA